VYGRVEESLTRMEKVDAEEERKEKKESETSNIKCQR
jgi:hypothetical protein